MKKGLKQIKWDIVVTSALYIVLGIVAILIPETMVRTLGYMIGSLLILAGAVSMICYLLRDAHLNYYRNEFLYGLVGISVGIIVLYKVEWIVSLVPMIMGLMVLISGCRKLQDVIDMKRMEYGNWVVMLILAAVNVIFGIVLILNPFETVLLLFQLVGVGLIFSGITDIIITFYFAGKIKDYLDRIYAVDSTFTEMTETEKPKKQDAESEHKSQADSNQTTESKNNKNQADGAKQSVSIEKQNASSEDESRIATAQSQSATSQGQSTIAQDKSALVQDKMEEGSSEQELKDEGAKQ